MSAAPASLDWTRDGADWPNRASSRFVDSGGLRWHVQQMGAGPPLLLLHGTGAATHSWRSLAPLLAAHFTVIALDLPGHGFTSSPDAQQFSLPGMARAIADLLHTLEVRPVLGLGHSAGAAVLARMCIDRHLDLAALIGINAALLPLRGLPGQVFLPTAKLLAASTLVPRLFSWRAAGLVATERMIRGTGSIIDAQGVALYERLVRNPGHVAGVLRMMANWDLGAFERDLHLLPCPLVLLVGTRDRTVRPADALRIRERLPSATIVELIGLGHLAHEERAAEVADHVASVAEQFLPGHLPPTAAGTPPGASVDVDPGGRTEA